MKNKSIVWISMLVLFLALGLATIRFVAGGNEDDWICDNGEWVRHGNPSTPKPTYGCGQETFAPSEPVLGGDEDEHGCIGSAGYSWCEPKQKCLRVWEEACQENAGNE